MPLAPIDDIHALQIQAGTVGRKAGHTFEASLAKAINDLDKLLRIEPLEDGHLSTGNPANILLRYVAAHQQMKMLEKSRCHFYGGIGNF